MKRKVIFIILGVAAVVAATAVYANWFRRDNSLRGSGTVEARNIRVGSEVGGRIDKVLVREGDAVQPGQVLVTFDDKELQASLEQSRAKAQEAERLAPDIGANKLIKVPSFPLAGTRQRVTFDETASDRY